MMKARPTTALPRLSTGKTATRIGIMMAAAISTSLHAADIHWDGGAAVWGTAANWSTDPTEATPNPETAPGSADDVYFNRAGNNTLAQVISLDANQAANRLAISNTGTTALTGTGANRVLTLGAGGLSATATAGSVTIGSATANQNVAITLGASQTWTNANNAATLTINNNVTGTNLNLGTGGNTTFRTGAVLNLGTGTLTHNGGNLELNNNNHVMGASVLKAGNIFVRSANALGTTGSLTLGNDTGSSTAVVRIGGVTLARPIVLQSGSTGSLRIDTLGASGGVGFSGGVTGTNNLEITSTNGGNMTVSSGAINPTGNVRLANIGTTGSGTLTVNSAIGSNVGTVTVVRDAPLAATSVVVLENTGNAWTGNTTINAGATLRLTAANVIPDGTGKGNVAVEGTLDLRGSETINGLSGSGLVTRGVAGATVLTVGGNNAGGTYSGVIQNGTGTIALVKTGTGTLTLSNANTYSAGTTLGNNGGTIAISNGGALGSGAVALTKGGTNGAMLDISGDITVPNNFTFASANAYATTDGGSAHIRNVSGNNTLSGTLTLTGTGGNGMNLESASGLLTVSGGISSTVPDDARDINLGGEGDGLITGTITESTGNSVALIKSGSGTWTVEGASSYTDDTVVRAGTLVFKAPNLNDVARVNIANEATLRLDYVGTDVIGRLLINGVAQAAGTWGAPGSGAEYTSDRISGTGLLLIDPVEFVWNDGAADGKWSTAGNWDVLVAPSDGALLRFGASTSTTLQNDFPALTNLEGLVFGNTAPSYLIDGNAITLTGRIEDSSGTNQTLGFDIALANDVTFQNSTGGFLTLEGDISGGYGITKTGAGELFLSGTNSYTGTTSIAAGGIVATGATSLPPGSTVAFKNTTGTAFLDISDLDQTLAGLTFGTQTSAAGIVTLYGNTTGTLEVSPANLTFAPAATPAAAGLTVAMDSLEGFTYNNPTGTFALKAGATTGSGVTTVTLAAGSNSITAASFGIAALNAAVGNRSVLNLGLENTIHADNLSLAAGSGRGSATLQYAGGLAPGGTLQIRNAAGTGAANVTVGKNSSYTGDSTVYTSLLDATGNSATLDALVSTLLIGNAQSDGDGKDRQVHSNGTFRMGAGTLTATTVEVSVLGGITPTGANNFTATGLLDLTGPGTANISTITLARNALPSLIGTTHLNGQVTLGGGARLNATTIHEGTVVPGETSRIARLNWNSGTISHLPAGDLTISGVAVVLDGEGTHAFEVSAERTATVSSVISGSGSALTKTGTGTLILSGANTHTADTVVSEGTLSVTQPTGFADTSSVTVAGGSTLNLNFSGSDTVAGLTLDGTVMGPGTYTASHSSGLITGDGALVIPGGDPFGTWMDTFTFAPEADKTRDGDADGDGMSNELEFALDGDPSSGVATGKVVSKIVSGHLTLTLPVRTGANFDGSGPLVSQAIDSVVYRIDGDDDLSGFTAGVEEVAALTENMPDLTDGWTYRSFRLTAPTAEAPKGFMRADASSPAAP